MKAALQREAFLNALFTDHHGERAHTVRLIRRDGLTMGGWCMESVQTLLAKYFPDPKPRTSHRARRRGRGGKR